MKTGKGIRWMAALQLLFELFLFYIMYEEGLPLGRLLLLLLFCLMLMGMEIGLAVWPSWRLNQTVRSLLREESTEKDLEEAAKTVQDMDEIKNLIDLYAARRTRKNAAEIFDKQTELTALQSQINPHFLYNTLDSIRAQALLEDSVEIAKMVEALASFFRYSISGKGSLVTLRDEIANINNYMMIQRYRFNNRFSLEVLIDEEDEEAYDFLIPRLIIQPVIENAIYHGLEERPEGGKVTIEVIVTEKYLIITVSDNGKGIGPEALKRLNERIHSQDRRLEDSKRKGHRNTGIALPNVHKRIQLLFGEEYGVSVYSTVNQGTDVEITIPIQHQRKEEQEDEERGIAYP